MKQNPDLLTDAAATNKKMKLIWICAGDTDFALAGAQKLGQTPHRAQHQAFVQYNSRQA